MGAARPLIQGGLVWGNQATNIIANGEAHNIRLLNNNQITPQSVFDYGVGGAVFGLAANGRLIVENSQIEANATSNNISALGIAANTASIQRTTVNAATQGLGNVPNLDLGPRTSADAVGVYTINQLTALKNSVIHTQSNGAVNNNGVANAYGVFSQKSNVNVSASTIRTITRGNVRGRLLQMEYLLLKVNQPFGTLLFMH